MDKDKVLKANDAFYNAFNQGDYAAMQELWASEHDVCVIHPGWAPIHGRAAVMKTWQQILQGPAADATVITNSRVYMLEGSAFVLCYEPVPQALLIATNVFCLEQGLWKMVHHQSGQVFQDVVEPGKSSVH